MPNDWMTVVPEYDGQAVHVTINGEGQVARLIHKRPPVKVKRRSKRKRADK